MKLVGKDRDGKSVASLVWNLECGTCVKLCYKKFTSLSLDVSPFFHTYIGIRFWFGRI